MNCQHIIVIPPIALSFSMRLTTSDYARLSRARYCINTLPLKTMPYGVEPSNKKESPRKGLISDRSSKGHSLLQDWPHRDMTLDCPTKKVTFSEYSQLRLYKDDRSYQSKKSCTAAEIKKFRAQAALDTSRIRTLISPFSPQTGDAIKHAIDLGLIKHEEILGIEHLVSEKVAANTLYERSAHVALTLRAQEVMQKKLKTVDAVMLAKVTCMSSSRCIERARMRAAWSLGDENLTCFSTNLRFKTFDKANDDTIIIPPLVVGICKVIKYWEQLLQDILLKK
eukprot:CCRYP_018823-RA/>CCRYP_018823-RA protein AED:0.35 eAED:0.44 QI:0/0/0/0.75/0/0/4/0/280